MNPIKPASSPPWTADVAENAKRPTLADILRDAGRADPVHPPDPVAPAVAAHCIATTETQRHTWLACQRGPAAFVAGNLSFGVRLEGALDLPALRRSFAQLTARHEALRITFSPAGDVQRIASDLTIDVDYRDFCAHVPALRAEQVARCADEHCHAPFDPVAGPLCRAIVMRIGPDAHLFYLTAHAFICDEWSLAVLHAELAELYSAEVQARPAELPPAPSFRQLADRHQPLRTSAAAIAAADFWQRQLPDALPVVELPSDRARSTVRNHTGGFMVQPVSPDVAAAVQRFSREQECSPDTVLLAAFAVLVHRLSGEEHVAVGVAAVGQETDEPPNAVGPLTNILPFAMRIRGEQPFTEVLAVVREQTAAMREHWRYPVATLLPHLNGPAGSMPLVPIVFNAVRHPGPGDFAGLRSERVSTARRFVPCELTFNVGLTGHQMSLECHYSTELYDEATMARWFGHFETLLRGIVTLCHSPVGDLPLLSERERHRLLVEWNQTDVPYDRETGVTELFRQQVRHAPDATAIVAGHERWSYAELDRRSDAIAAFLRERGIGAEAKVGIFLARSPLLLATMLGVMKAGAAYVPLDVALPAERLGFIARDTAMRVVLTQRSLHTQFPAGEWEVAPLDDFAHALPATPAGALHPPASDDLAYVIYTSGSTGRPKGVCVTHGCLAGLVAWANRQYRAEELSGVLFATSASFDVSLFETIVPLCLGGKIIIAPNIVEFGWLPALGEIKLISGVPSAVTELVRNGLVPASVTTVNLAGEPCPQSLVDELYALPHIERVYDMYGPTETTVYSTGALRARAGRATIGRPLPNEKAYILDRQMQPVPVGVRGELYIGGDKVACGYLNLPELTEARFLDDPFHPGGRMYRTGDAARFLADGTIEFLGRLDHQVKIRGYRIEPGEIETVLAGHPAVAECVVIARGDASAAKLLAYVVPVAGSRVDAGALRAHLSERVPEYMVPAAFILLPKLRRTSSGKIDRRALPDPEFGAPREHFVAPRSTAEELLADIWRDVLGLKQVGVHDSFFDLGGHSLLAVQVIVRLQDSLNVDLTIQQLFSAPTIALLANVIEAALLEQINAGPTGSPGTGLVYN